MFCSCKSVLSRAFLICSFVSGACVTQFFLFFVDGVSAILLTERQCVSKTLLLTN